MSAADYKTEADENIKLAQEYPIGYQHLTTSDLIALAQVNATLALAEQQRIANLIAYSNVLEENQRDGYELTDDGKSFMDRLEAQIRKGLGLS